ncbi:hypothetical protein VII00023_06237 [Vibrio ichthyoenteri ATCC 700023]|uniref:Uncharacterized protein n=1 Tax=Vibrio ichthyoenteri ATCC 700023 TaxID=870968 RepID=F9RXI8_9VIBR|nr:hypothetical protein [Vibrio ichthyoenteri]EGU47912.1 hypothetical protein VII00023_06237 [Vibrio ichthyoenteri ATCC 700023]
MNKNNEKYDAESDEAFRNLQQLIAKLISDIGQNANESGKEVWVELKRSQYRLLKYKELLLHQEHIAESELFLARTELSSNEKKLGHLGIDALSMAINALDKELTP